MAGPLDGIRVLEFSQVIAAPYAGQFLADFGADVLKVEPPGGESWRLQAAFAPAESKSFQTLNRGKRCLTLQLAHPDAQAIVHRLVPEMDVVLINYRPDVPKKFRIDYDTLRELRPDLIYVDLTAFGRRGPWALKPGYDGVVQAVSGLMAGEGKLRPDGSPATIASTAIADFGSGMVLADAVVTALFHRARTGEGQFVQCSLLATALSLQGAGIMEHQSADAERNRLRDLRQQRALDGTPYEELVQLRELGTRPANDIYARAYLVLDGAIVVSADSPDAIAALRRRWVCDLPVAGEPGYVPHDTDFNARCASEAKRIEALFARRTTQQCLDELRADGVPAGPVHFPEEMGDNPQVQANHLLARVRHESTGDQWQSKPALTFSHSPLDELRPSPPLGRDTRAVLQGELGVSDERIEQLRADGVI